MLFEMSRKQKKNENVSLRISDNTSPRGLIWSKKYKNKKTILNKKILLSRHLHINRMLERLFETPRANKSSLKSRPGKGLKRSERMKRKFNPGRKTLSGSHLFGGQRQDLSWKRLRHCGTESEPAGRATRGKGQCDHKQQA